jgi:hypothetical protein
LKLKSPKSLNDRWLRIIGVPIFALLATVVFYSDQWLDGSSSFTKCYLVSLSNTFIFWQGNRQIVIFFRRVFPSIKETLKRVFYQLFSSTIFSLGISFLISYIFDLKLFWGYHYATNDYLYNGFVVLIFVYTAIAIYELTYYFSEWQESIKETEKLKKAQLQSQYDTLKSQISPHFLFNSLNTLSSLIEEDPKKGVEFVDQLSKVYRYLLQSNEKGLTTLREELEFLNAYFFLLKKRFDDGISLNIEINEQQQNLLIPPLTLQILVENAVKHNIVSIHKPLLISLSINNQNMVTVENNFQKKTVNVASMGMGLANISAKYRLLNDQEIEVQSNDDFFKVSVPLLNI